MKCYSQQLSSINNLTNHITRRNFLSYSVIAGLSAAISPVSALADDGMEDNVSKIVADTIGIDVHNHMDMPYDKTGFSANDYDLLPELTRSGLAAICMTFSVDRPTLVKAGEAYDRFLANLDEMDALLIANKIQRALNFSDIKKAHAAHKKTVIQAVEGAHFIEGKPERLQMAYNRGLRHLGLMHDGQSTPPLGDIYTDKPAFGGMTAYGLEVVKECNRLGILIDLAHCSNEAIDDVLEVTTKPVLISHPGLNTRLGNNERMAQMMMPRLISKEQAKIVAGKGGVIGVWTHLAETPSEYAANIRALVDVIGTDHVCIGTDTKMAPSTKSSGREAKKTNEEWAGQDKGFYYSVVEALLKAGFTKQEIAKIGGDNYFRIFDAATSA